MPLDKAFAEWKSAHDKLLTLERMLADAESLFACRGDPQPIELRDAVQKHRAACEQLLDGAMKLLHKRAGGLHPPTA